MKQELKLRNHGPATKVYVAGRWEELKTWFLEGRSQGWVANELGVTGGGLSQTLKVLIREGLPDPRPQHFTSRSLAFKISKDWDVILERLKKGETVTDLAASYSRNPLTFAAEANRVARLTKRDPLLKAVKKWRYEKEDPESEIGQVS